VFDDALVHFLWLIPALPLFAAAITGLFARFFGQAAHWPCIFAAGTSCALSVVILIILPDNGRLSFPLDPVWFQAGDVSVNFSLLAMRLTAVMLVTVTLVGTLIAIYSAGYMRGDPGYARFFCFVSLFLFFMTLLVLANNLVVLYAGWEGVGLCSYLLIGHWYQRPSAAAAARKAFLVTRLGDAGMILGILTLWHGFGHTLELDRIFTNADARPDPALLTTACLLLFCGAVGKSAQFPLHVWLADAMEGPTPVSALIHAATMVTAGVYLVARCMPLFALAPAAQLTVAVIGAFTALLAAAIAVTQNDLKRVLAYSTMSQLGFMFLVLGAGRGNLMSAAVVAAIFHLFTHAIFKALLFLSAGSVMHAMGDVIDMRRFGGLARVLPVTHATFLCGALALAGVPLLSGFWSKDAILETVLHAGEHGPAYRTVYLILFGVALFTAGLTAFYTFRAYFMTFWGERRVPPEAGDLPHESPAVMLVPLVILSLGALFAGALVNSPVGHWLSGYLSGTSPMAKFWLSDYLEGTPRVGQVWHPPSFNWLLAGGSSLMALLGIGAAYVLYARSPGLADRLAMRFRGLYRASAHRFYIDEVYEIAVVKPLTGLAVVCRYFDAMLDDVVVLLSQVPRGIGALLRPIQNGLVQFYGLAMVMGLAVFLAVLLGYLDLILGR
jgi:NADH-quinone oxidoreductase subunit L